MAWKPADLKDPKLRDQIVRAASSPSPTDYRPTTRRAVEQALALGHGIAKSVQPKTRLNNTEAEFMARLKAGEYGKFTWIGVQAIRLELADRCTYTPDFATRMELGDFRFWEVKGGFIREDGWIKLKMAARLYPWWPFVKAQKKGGVWTASVVSPGL